MRLSTRARTEVDATFDLVATGAAMSVVSVALRPILLVRVAARAYGS